MATTGFWPVRGSLKSVIDYAENPDKTTDKSYLDNDLYNALRYVENDDKTDQKMYVTGINCSKHLAYEQMMAVKQKYGDRGTVVAYHGYQSFREGEVAPDEAHAIGVELARRMWGDRFQVVVTTHLNTNNLHNHFVVNSISFRDGGKYRNSREQHKEIRRISDELCREHGKSVLENAEFYGGKHRGEYWYEKKGGVTHREMLRKDIEYCLTYSSNWRELEKQLYGLGYTIDYTRMSVKGKDWQRAVRLKRLGYTEDVIIERFKANCQNPYFYATWNSHLPKKRRSNTLNKLLRELEWDIDHTNSTGEMLVDVIFYIMITLFKILAEVTGAEILSPELRHEMRDVKQFVEDYRFLRDNNLHTMNDLKKCMDDMELEIGALIYQRDKLKNKVRHEQDTKVKAENKAQRAELTSQIKLL